MYDNDKPFAISEPVTMARPDAIAPPIPRVTLHWDIVRINVQLASVIFLAADGWHYLRWETTCYPQSHIDKSIRTYHQHPEHFEQSISPKFAKLAHRNAYHVAR